MASATQPINIRPRSDSNFLTLAPVQSSTFPDPPASDISKAPLSSSPEQASVDSRAGTVVGSLAVMLEERKRAAAAAGESPPPTFRFLRLGPVHHGGDDMGDFADE